ncbi:hypothetical protein D3C76_1521600 [compost metagenome]
MERRQHVVLRGLVRFDEGPADRFFRYVERDMHGTVRLRRRGHRGQLQGIQRPPNVAVGHRGNVQQRLLVDLQRHKAKSFLLIRQGPPHRDERMLLRQ